MDCEVLAINYKQMGIVATLGVADDGGDATAHDDDNHHTAWQRFLPAGPVALLPLAPAKSSLVWTTTPEEAKRLTQVPAEQFVAELNEALVREHSIRTKN